MEVLRRSEFEAAATAYAAFLRRYPDSGYTPSSLCWLGNAQYASRAYKEAMESHRRLITQFPAHMRTPEAMLAMANSQIELKDGRSARRTLEDLVKTHPDSEAAAAGRERLARLR
jgi:tol-pal system protein YbgF